MFNGLPHFWINRRIDTERRALIEACFSSCGIEHARVEATTPDTLPKVSVRKPFTNSMAELAIIASHLDAIGTAYRAGCAHAVILEDDMRSGYLFDASALIASAPKDWEILQLHVSNRPVVLELGEIYLRHALLWHEWEPSCFSAGAYLISRQGAERILARYRPAGADIDLTGVHAFGKLVADHLIYRRARCYTATIPYFFNDMTLASTHAPNRDDTHHRPGALGVENVMQRIVDRFSTQGGTMPGHAPAGYPFALRALSSLPQSSPTLPPA